MCRELNFATAILFLQGRRQIIIAKKKKKKLPSYYSEYKLQFKPNIDGAKGKFCLLTTVNCQD